MKTGIIGTGSIGGTLAKKIQQAGHDVRIANSKGLSIYTAPLVMWI